MWYSETLLIVLKDDDRKPISSDHNTEPESKIPYTSHDSISRKHNCANYGGLCRNITCPESSKCHRSSYKLGKTQNKRVTIKVLQAFIHSALSKHIITKMSIMYNYQ